MKKPNSSTFFVISLFAYLATATTAHAFEDNYLYLQANLGYADQPWKKVFGTLNYPDSVGHTSWSNGNGGVTYGFNIGYHAFKHLGAEVGYFGFTRAKLTSTNSDEFGFSKASFHANDVYLAARALLPISSHFQLFAKAGIHSKIISGSKKTFNNAWRYQEPTTVGPAFAAGLQYMINQKVGLNLQYFYLGGRIKNINAASERSTSVNPNTQLFTFGFVYNISLE
jgi:opacity protein-like surface antigen